MGLRSIFRNILNRDKFTTRHQVVSETYIKTDDRVHAITEKDVHAAAAVLEAAYTMSEDVPHDQVIALSTSRTELHSFVGYMRQLDHTYREQCEFIKRHIKPMTWSPEKSEFQTSEETAQISAERYAQLTGAHFGDSPQRRAGEFFKDAEGYLQVAERKFRTGKSS